jgi:cysteinyl-tRNA synthetase
MALHLFNYLTREKEPFEPLTPGRVGVYVCGPTVYDDSHVGHAKLYVAMDVLVRYLRYLKYTVRYVQNITDVGHILDTGEDRIMKGVRLKQLEPMELVERYMRFYFEDMDALGVTRPNISPRASCHIPEQIELVETLLSRGYAYETEHGDVYFSVEAFPEYGKLSGRKVSELEPGARVAVREEKRHPADFALWKHAEPEHILRWPSPWGPGFPGWHAECSAMATKYLGQTFDIHGGGLENIFPHNECEVAQSEAASGEAFARYWVLSGSLTINGVKMSKSLGNSLTIKDALRRFSPEAIRAFVLSAHYRGPIDFTEEAVTGAEQGVRRLHNTVRNVRARLTATCETDYTGTGHADLDRYRQAFNDAMDDDLNTPRALAALHDMAREVNRWLDGERELDAPLLLDVDHTFRSLGGAVLGIVPDDLAVGGGAEAGLVDGLVSVILDIRREHREAREWARADALRDRLAQMGIAIEDRPDGATWRLENH